MENNSILPYVLLCLLSVFFAAVSQVMLKKAALKQYGSVIREYLNPLVIFAYVIFFGTTLVNVLVYKGLPLSLGPVLETTGYIYVTIFGVLIFKEKVTRRTLLALGVIVTGILIYALG